MDAAAPTVSAERAFFYDVRLVLAVLNQARYPLLRRVFGVSRDQANLLTFVLALGAANVTYDALRRFIRHPWPFDGPDTIMGAAVVREAGFGIAGPKVAQAHVFGALIAFAAMKGLTLPEVRRALHGLHVVEQRIGEQRKRIYGATVEQLKAERQPASNGRRGRVRVPTPA
jgi:hypothetical protein